MPLTRGGEHDVPGRNIRMPAPVDHPTHTKRYPYNSGTLCELLNENVSYRALNTLFANEKIAAYKGGERMGAASD